MSRKLTQQNYKLTIPLDASSVEGRKSDQPVKVAVQDSRGKITSQLVRFDTKGKATATFNFTTQPGSVRVIVGPQNATDEEMLGLQTINQTVQWRADRELKLTPLIITPWYWRWWLIWCRSFTVHGRVVCPDGSPVPGATVCAFDVSWWWWWISKRQVGCAVTNQDGTFQIRFNWCCGWWPWWWWRYRVWQLDTRLSDIIHQTLRRNPILPRPPLPDPRPDLNIFAKLLTGRVPFLSQPSGATEKPAPTPQDVPRAISNMGFTPGINSPGEGASGDMAASVINPATMLQNFDPSVLTGLRDQLVRFLPQAPELERLHIWPWWPWMPWAEDCNPDLIFRVTQNCHDHEVVIINEGFSDTRWNIPADLNVTLTATDDACCLVHNPGDPVGNCVNVDHVCGYLITQIAGNPGAPIALPNEAGFVVPGDRPFAGTVTFSGLIGDAVDYYEFQWSFDDGASWNAMPPSAVGDVVRQYWILGTTNYVNVPFLRTIDGRLVYETRRHYEANNDPATWGVSRFWTLQDFFTLTYWLTSLEVFADGKYLLRVVGYDLSGAGHLVPVATTDGVLPVCGTPLADNVTVTLDNRLEGAGSGHPPSVPDHPCGDDTIHICTLEPDTDFLDVRIIHPPSVPPRPDTIAGACSNIAIGPGDILQIDFTVSDPNGHLAYYTLDAYYGENLVKRFIRTGSTPPDLLDTSGSTATLTAGAGVQVGPNYSNANPARSALNQGAVPPIWNGGTFRFTVPALSAFPETCCYLLELRAYKRTVVGCYTGNAHGNVSQYSFMVVR